MEPYFDAIVFKSPPKITTSHENGRAKGKMGKNNSKHDFFF